MYLRISALNNAVSVPIVRLSRPDLERSDTGLTVEVTWENGDLDIVRLPIPALNALIHAAHDLKQTHPAFATIQLATRRGTPRPIGAKK